MEQDLGRRERKKRDTRAALSAAALRLSAERGIGRVTVEQIASEAGVSVRTFFNYFTSKDDAVAAGDPVIAEALVTAFRERPADEPVLVSVRAAVLAVVDEENLRREAERLGALRQEPGLLLRRLSAFAEQERALAAAVAERVGSASADLYPDLVATCVLGTVRVVVQRLRGEGGELPGSLAALLDASLAQLEAGLGAPISSPRARPTAPAASGPRR